MSSSAKCRIRTQGLWNRISKVQSHRAGYAGILRAWIFQNAEKVLRTSRYFASFVCTFRVGCEAHACLLRVPRVAYVPNPRMGTYCIYKSGPFSCCYQEINLSICGSKMNYIYWKIFMDLLKLFTDIRNYLPTWRILDKCVLTSLAPFTSELRPLWAPCWCFAMTSACEYPQLTRTEFWACSKLSAGNLYLRTQLRVRSVWSARQVLELPEAKIVPRNLLARLFRFDATLPSVRNDINHLRHLIVNIHILVSQAYRRNILRRHTSFQPIYSHLYCSFQVKWYHTDIISEK